jgi:hypothetical protein
MTNPTCIRAAGCHPPASAEFPWSGEAEVLLFLADDCTPRRLGRPKHQYGLSLRRHFA